MVSCSRSCYTLPSYTLTSSYLGQERPLRSPHLHALPRIQLWPHIEIEARPRLAIGASSVEVDHVLNPRAAAVDDPVVSVERRRVAQDGVDTGRGRHAVHLVGEGFELGAAASVIVSAVHLQLGWQTYLESAR